MIKLEPKELEIVKNILRKIDLLDWQRITPEFQKIINQRFEVLTL